MTDTELLRAIGTLIDEKLEPINNKLDSIEEKLVDMDNAVGVITDWIEKSSDLNRVPFLQAK